MNVFELFAKLGLDSSEYDKGLEGAERSASGFGDKLKTGLGAAAGVATAAIATTTAATIGAAKAFIGGASDVAMYGDEIDKTSQKIGLSAESYQEWDYVMQIAGTSMSNMTIGMKTLTNQLDNAKNGSEDAISKFEALGITMEDIQSMSREELFEKTIEGFQGMAESTERAALANDLFGRSGQELTPLFNMTAEETQNLIDKANQYGMVMSDEAVKASAGFKDELTTLQSTVTGFKNNMMADFLPSISGAMSGLSAIFSGTDIEGGLAQIEENFKALADNLAAKAPQLMQIGGSILNALASSITANLPVLLETAVPIILELANSIIDNLPAILDAVITVIGQIATALSDNLPTIMEAVQGIIVQLVSSIGQNAEQIVTTIVDVLLTIIDTLTNPTFMTQILQAGIEILMGLIRGILSAIPKIIEQLPVIIDNIVQTLLQGLPLILDAAIQIFMALVEAIPIILESLVEALPSIINTIIDFVIGAIPMLLDAAIQLLMALIQAIPTILMALIENLPKIIITIVTTLIENIPKLIEGAIQLFMGIIQAIPQICIELVKNLPQIIVTIVEGIMSGLGQIAEVGANLIRGLWEGIKNVGAWLWDKISGFFSGIFDKIKGFFGIHSPSALFRDQIGKNLALGIGEGFEDEMGEVGDQMTDSAQNAVDAVAGALSEPLGNFEINGRYNMKANASGRAGASSEAIAMAEQISAIIDAKLAKMEFIVPVYIGGKKIDQQVVSATARAAVISGGR